MTINMGGLDRVLRVVLGIALIAWGLYSGSLWGAVGVVPLLTAGLKWCPFYTLIGVCTRKSEC